MWKRNLCSRIPLRPGLIAIVAIVPVAWMLYTTNAANRTWTGSSNPPNPSWEIPFNWSGNTPPVAGDALIFPAGVAQILTQNTFPAETPFNSITFNGIGYLLAGNTIRLNQGVFSNAAGGNQISLPIKLTGPVEFDAVLGASLVFTAPISNNGFELKLDGFGAHALLNVIGGAGTLSKSGNGRATLVANNVYTGATIMRGGNLLINGSQPQSEVILHGGTVGGIGTVGPLTADLIGTGCFIDPGGLSGTTNETGILNVNGNLRMLNSPFEEFATLIVDLNGAAAGTGYDQLNVAGTVLLEQNDPTLQISLGFIPPAGTSFVIIQNDNIDAVQGTFSELPEGASFTTDGVTFFITYRGGDGNDVVLHVPETKTWDGGGANNNWTTGANWVGNIAPQVGDDLVFPQASQKLNNNDFPANTTFKSINISGSAYTLNGNAVKVETGFANTNDPAVLSITTINLVIGGTGSLTQSGTNSFNKLVLSGNNTYTGTTTVNAGVLTVNGNQPASSVVLAAGTLEGLGTVGPITANGGVVEPGNFSPSPGTAGTLNASGNVVFSNSAFHSLITNGQASQLNVIGTVSITNSTLALVSTAGPPPTTDFTIINNDGADAINGTFNGKPEGAVFNIGPGYRLTYRGGDGNDVVLQTSETKIWDGGGANNNWTTGANWVGDNAPEAGDDLVFPLGASQLLNNNDFPPDVTFHSINISGRNYTLNGNAIKLQSGLVTTDGGASDNPTNTNTINLVIGGVGSLTKSDINDFARLVLSANNTYTGTTTVNEGLLTVNGNQPASPVIVAAGGTLEGSGTVGPITTNGFGQVKPGITLSNLSPPTPATLNAIGNVTLTVDSIYSAVIVNGQASQLNVTGTVNINNGRLASSQSGDIPHGTNFTIINNDGADAIIGTFNGLPEGSAVTLNGRAFRITYSGGDGNDVVITRIAELSINDVSIAEGNAGITNATFTVTLSPAISQIATVDFATRDNSADAGSDYVATSGTITFNPNETSRTITVQINGDTAVESGESFLVLLTNPINAGLGDPIGVATIVDDDAAPTIRFNLSNYTASECDHITAITVTRTGDPSAPATVDYEITDNSASERKDYTTTLGTLRFATGETQKAFDVLLTDDGFVESIELINLLLSNATGAQLGNRATATLIVIDNDSVPSPTNPIDDTAFFVRMHYHDFLNREPDAGGLAFWLNQIESCGADAQCREIKRINVSAAFFLSIEFQETGYLVHRIYKAAFGNLPGKPVPVQLRPFLKDTHQIGEGVQVGIGDWEFQLEQNKQAFLQEFVTRAQFLSSYPLVMPPEQFVDTLNANSGGALSTSERNQLVAELISGAKTRAQVVRAVAEDQTLRDAEFRKAFVMMQYFGYLRRNPDDIGLDGQPDPNFEGFNFWLNKLNQFNGNFVEAEMVRAFISSIEYRERFR